MPRAHYVDTLLGTSGTGVVSVLGGATIHVYDQGTTDLVSQTLYTSDAGSGTLTNPFTSEADGTVELWLATAARVDLVATKTGYATIRRTVDVEDVPGTGGGSVAPVYSHICDGAETHLTFPDPVSDTLRRVILVHMPDPGVGVQEVLGLTDGGSPATNTLAAGLIWNVAIEILFPASDAPAGRCWNVSDHGGGDPSGLESFGWFGAGGSTPSAVPAWTLWNVDATSSPPTYTFVPFPAGTLVVVLDT